MATKKFERDSSPSPHLGKTPPKQRNHRSRVVQREHQGIRGQRRVLEICDRVEKAGHRTTEIA